MPIKLSDFKRNFPAGVAVPPMLEKLLEFQNKKPEFYSGHFELAAGGVETATASFAGDAKTAAQFCVFGHEADDSSLAFWCYEGHSLENAPIAYLGSEGSFFVLADSLADFLRLLAVGADDFGIFTGRESEEPAPRLAEFRKWLKKEFQLTPAEKPEEMIAAAQRKHPDLGAFLAKWQKEFFK